ncbi:MAG: molecular chaperone [Betaproteobacteria bacterium]|nr:molecular chaperone [Betaproteobacteria bacterium]
MLLYLLRPLSGFDSMPLSEVLKRPIDTAGSAHEPLQHRTWLSQSVCVGLGGDGRVFRPRAQRRIGNPGCADLPGLPTEPGCLAARGGHGPGQWSRLRFDPPSRQRNVERHDRPNVPRDHRVAHFRGPTQTCANAQLSLSPRAGVFWRCRLFCPNLRTTMMFNTCSTSPPIFTAVSFRALLRNTVVCWLGLALGLAQADMVIDTTRVIYPEGRREVTLKVTNTAKDKPALVQLWLDDGNPSKSIDEIVTPFNLSPPVARLRAEGSQVVRLTYTGDPLPSDRESVFWFNMLEVPQKSAEENKISFAVRTRIKVFYRPKALREDPATLMDRVTWKVFQKDGQWMAEATNPTPFNMSFFGLSFGQSGNYDVLGEGGMVPPLGKATFTVSDAAKVTKPYNQFKIDYVNDFGGKQSIELPVAVAP